MVDEQYRLTCMSFALIISLSFISAWRKWLAENQIQLTTSVTAHRAQCKINIGFMLSQLQHSVYKWLNGNPFKEKKKSTRESVSYTTTPTVIQAIFVGNMLMIVMKV